MIRRLSAAMLLVAVLTAPLWSGGVMVLRPAHAEEKKKAPPPDPTFGVQKDKMQSANKNAQAVKSLLRTAPPDGRAGSRSGGGGASSNRVR